jgi:hypothetical protein
MTMDRTWCRIDPKRRSLIFYILLAFTVAVMIGMQFIGSPLQTEAAPAGIVSFEFAGDLSTAQAMIDSWGTQGLAQAGLSLGLDYLFLVAYSATIALGCSIVSRNLHSRFAVLIRLGRVLGLAQFLAALLDALENYALIRILLGSENAIWPQVAYWNAGPKFLIVLMGILYVLIGALISLAPSNRATAAPAS